MIKEPKSNSIEVKKDNQDILDYTNIENIKKIFRSSKIIEKFELQNYIGKSSSGFVIYQGKTKISQENYILKFCPNKNLKNQKNKSENIQEILPQKNLETFFEYKENNETFSCSLIKGKNLDYIRKFVLKNKRFSESFICYIAKEILEGLNYCNSVKILHMDIKEENIILDDDLVPKISDFSSSYSYRNISNNSKNILPLVGTYFYMSPEVFNSQKISFEECVKSDLYSLGMLLYHLASGDFLFPDFTGLSDNFIDFLKEGLLITDVEKRFDIKQALNHPWLRAADILIEEKEKLDNSEQFLQMLFNNGCKKFNDLVKIKK